MAAPSFDSVNAARHVLRAASTGALGTLTPEGAPFVSFVTVATDVDGTPLLLLSTLAIHTRNIAADPRISLLLVAPGGEGGDPLAGARITVEASARRIGREDSDWPRLSQRFLARHPQAEGYASFADFSFYRLEPVAAHLVAGFGRIHRVEKTDILVENDTAAAFAEAEAGVISHMNEDHADAVQRYATHLLKLADGNWSVTACDPDGIDIGNEAGEVHRLAFPKRQVAVMDLRSTLKSLSDKIRPDA